MSLLPLPPASRQLGPDGPAISPIAWGMWRLAEGGRSVTDAARLVHAAIDAGITLLDTADIYGFDGSGGFGDAEALLGEVLTAEPGLRSRFVLSSKGGIMPPLPYDQSPAYLARAIDASLKRLWVEHIDLWHIHRPDLLAHPQEVAHTLDDAVRAGKLGALAVSNFTLHQTAALQQFLTHKLVATQPEISPLAWSPLGGGRLADPQTPRDKAVAAELDRVAAAQGVSRSVAAYAWLMAHPAGIVPIIGSQQESRIAEGTAALTMRWTRQDWYAVLVAARGAPMP